MESKLDKALLSEIDDLGQETGELANELGKLIRAVEDRINQLPGRVEAQAVEPLQGQEGWVVRLRYRRHENKQQGWGIYVNRGALADKKTGRIIQSAPDAWLPDASLDLKVDSCRALPALFLAIREAQQEMVNKLAPAVTSLQNMVEQLRQKEGA